MDVSIEGNFFINGSFIYTSVGIRDGRIYKIKKNLKYENHFNFKNKLILPAGIDIHVHFRDPGMTNKEDFYTGSVSAAFGGISCVFDMPNTRPQTTTSNDVSDKISIASKKSIVDFGIYAGVTDENFDRIGSISRNCNGFKLYLGSSTNSLLFKSDNLYGFFKHAEKLGKPVLFHAEKQSCLEKYQKEENNIIEHLAARPSICEKKAITDVLKAAENFKIPIHFCHISSKEGLTLLKKNKKNFFSCGITPHHALLSVDNKKNPQSYFKVNPPIRKKNEQNFLFQNILKGSIDVLESDHAPHTKEEKNQIFDISPCGIPGVETMYPLFLYMASKNILSWNLLVNLMCRKPAEILGLQKGKIAEDYDADFIVIDPNDVIEINSKALHSKCGWSPFEGFKAIFPSSVFIRGQNVIRDGEILVNKGFGCKL